MKRFKDILSEGRSGGLPDIDLSGDLSSITKNLKKALDDGQKLLDKGNKKKAGKIWGEIGQELVDLSVLIKREKGIK